MFYNVEANQFIAAKSASTSQQSILTLSDYIEKQLPITKAILSCSTFAEPHSILAFVNVKFKDAELPYTKPVLIKRLNCSDAFANGFLKAQSLSTVTFNPGEFKTLSSPEIVPFAVDTGTKLRTGGFGMVERVIERGTDVYARKTLRDNYDTVIMRMELTVLRLATRTKNPHLLHLRCAYEQNSKMCLVTYPWCEIDLRTILLNPMPFWTNLHQKARLVLMTDWMACLASGLSALHQTNVKHQDLKPENVLMYVSEDKTMMPVICDFGLSKAFVQDSISIKVQGTTEYFPPEQFTGKVGRSGDVFSLGLIYVELGLLFMGHQSLKYYIKSGFYMDITNNLTEFLTTRFPLYGVDSYVNDWCARFRCLIMGMLNIIPVKRPTAAQVHLQLKEMVKALGATPHCCSEKS